MDLLACLRSGLSILKCQQCPTAMSVITCETASHREIPYELCRFPSDCSRSTRSLGLSSPIASALRLSPGTSLTVTTPPAKITEKGCQRTWLDMGLPDLRSLHREMRAQAIEEIAAADSHDDAIELVAQHFGLSDSPIAFVVLKTPLGGVQVRRSCICHIVEKRQDARERYAQVALDTLTGPFEVWSVAYTNDTHRLAFIRVYETKRQMLVIVTLESGKMLWNFMQCDAKALNKHRHGELLFKRYAFLPNKEKGHCNQ